MAATMALSQYATLMPTESDFFALRETLLSDDGSLPWNEDCLSKCAELDGWGDYWMNLKPDLAENTEPSSEPATARPLLPVVPSSTYGAPVDDTSCTGDLERQTMMCSTPPAGRTRKRGRRQAAAVNPRHGTSPADKSGKAPRKRQQRVKKLLAQSPATMLQISEGSGGDDSMDESGSNRTHTPAKRRRKEDGHRRKLEDVLPEHVLQAAKLGEKPDLSYAQLIAIAIFASSCKCVSVADVYQRIEDKFPYYKHGSLFWKNCIRHNLSSKHCFVKMDKGAKRLWALCPSLTNPLDAAKPNNWHTNAKREYDRDLLAPNAPCAGGQSSSPDS